MSLSFKTGKPIAKDNKKIIFLDSEDVNNPMYHYESKGRMEIIPNPDQRQVIYVVGSSGSGKSTICMEYLKKYHKMFPDNELYIFSGVKEDPLFEDLPTNTRFVDFDEDFLDYEIDMKHFENSCVIIDDSDYLKGEYKKKMNEIKDTLLGIGRHYNTHVIFTSHIMFESQKSKMILREAQVVAYCPSQNGYDGQRFLKQYCSLSPKEINFIHNLPTRWIYIYRDFPKLCVYDKGIFVIGKYNGVVKHPMRKAHGKVSAIFNL